MDYNVEWLYVPHYMLEYKRITLTGFGILIPSKLKIYS